MKISGIIWLREIVEKINRKHRVEQEEIREIKSRQALILSAREMTDSERKRYEKR